MTVKEKNLSMSVNDVVAKVHGVASELDPEFTFGDGSMTSSKKNSVPGSTG